MAFGKNFLLVTAGLVCLLGYHIYKPMPTGVAEPWKASQIMALHKLVSDVCWLGQKLGVGTYNDLFRMFISLDIGSKNHTALRVEDHIINGVPVRIYTPLLDKDKGTSRAIVFYHGGGFMWGSIDMPSYGAAWSRLAREIPAVLVTVSYRLAPEHPYPTPLEDCVQATKGFIDVAKKFGVSPSRIAIAGDSAGGNLAAAVALRLRDEEFKVQPKSQILIYPLLQAVDFQLPSYVDNTDKVWGSMKGAAHALLTYMGVTTDPDMINQVVENKHTSLKTKEKYRKLIDVGLLPDNIKTRYRGSLSDGNIELERKLERVLFNPYTTPLVAEDLSRLPSAFVLVCEFDVLRDDGLIYAKRLEKSGVKVLMTNYEGGYHGIFNYISPPLETDIGKKFLQDVIEYARNEL